MSIIKELLQQTNHSIEHLLEISQIEVNHSKETNLVYKKCDIHGITGHYRRKRTNRKDYIEKCYLCEKINKYLFKERAANYLGGKCSVCGYNKYQGALDFHHVNPEEKEYDVSHKCYLKWDDLVKEVDKCILLCANCHTNHHTNIDFVKDINNNSYNWQTRELICNLHGSKCSICSNDNINSLCYHHIEPSTKSFMIGRAIKLNYKTQRIINESKKCIMICENCHREYHSQLFHKNIEMISSFNETLYKEYKEKEEYKNNNRTCKYCGKSITNKMFCNAKCRDLYYVKPTEEELSILIKDNSYARIGNMFNVTGNAVKKWVIEYGLEYKIKGKIPTRKEYKPSIEKDILQKYVNDGLSMIKMAKETNSTPDKIKRMMVYYELKIVYSK